MLREVKNMKKKKQFLIILCGEAFSGKTTLSKSLAKKFEAKIIGRDKIYFALDKMLAFEDSPYDSEDNLWKNLLWPIMMQGIKNQLLLGNSVVVDDNCLFLDQRQQLRNVAGSMNVRNVLIYMNISAGMLKKRRQQNKKSKMRHDVPSSWLEKDFKKFQRPNKKENPIIFSDNDSTKDLFKKIDKILSNASLN